MASNPIWKVREVVCPEENRTACLLLEWGFKKGESVLCGIICDHPGFKSLDNWECGCSCWEKIEREGQG